MNTTTNQSAPTSETRNVHNETRAIERTPEDKLRFERDMARIELSQVTAQRDELLVVLKDSVGWLNNSDVRYLISNKLGEQASLHSTLNKARAAISKAE